MSTHCITHGRMLNVFFFFLKGCMVGDACSSCTSPGSIIPVILTRHCYICKPDTEHGLRNVSNLEIDLLFIRWHRRFTFISNISYPIQGSHPIQTAISDCTFLLQYLAFILKLLLPWWGVHKFRVQYWVPDSWLYFSYPKGWTLEYPQQSLLAPYFHVGRYVHMFLVWNWWIILDVELSMS